ncbi:MAG: FtsX-like permease family protein [Planctomycetota bacterium]|jgi:putative ABC transport system permease protein|nr:FtsX-like permease family protein [Planctomycetota bacterium]MDP7252466.1 FtsX-like permease family protein [Planctomycetota bacterium]
MPFRIIFRALVWRHLKNDWVRTLITLLGVMLGVSVVVAIRLANMSVLGSFSDSVERVAGRANLQIRGDGFPFDEVLLADIEWVFPHAEVSPAVTGTIVLNDRREELVEVLGVDLFHDQRTRDYRLLQATKKERQDEVSHFLSILTERDSIILTEKFAKRAGIEAGSSIDVLAEDRLVKLKVMDLIADDGLGLVMSGNIALMDIAAAQWLFQKIGKLDRIDLVVQDKQQITEIQSRLEEQLPGFVTVEPPSSRTKQVEKMVGAYQLNLTALSWIALFVGVFLVYNTVSIAVIRRRREIGISRALGAPRSGVAWAFGIESAALGAIGSAFGIPAGWFLAVSSVDVAAKTASSFYERVVVENPALDATTLVLGLATGLGLSLLAGILPVREAMNVPPAEATRTGTWDGRRRSQAWPYFGVGLVLLSLSWIAALQPPFGRKPVFGFLSAFLIILGFSFLAPICIQFIQLISRKTMSSLFGSPGRIASANLSSALGRTAITVAALMIGLSMTIGMGIMIESFRNTVDIWVGQTARSDLWIKAASSHRLEGRISKKTIDRIGAVKGVKELDPYREIHTTYNSSPVILGAGRFKIAAEYSLLPMKEGGKTDEALLNSMQNDGCIVSESFATYHQVKTGDTLQLPTPAGELSLLVTGVYYEYSNDRGYIIIDRKQFIERFGDPSANVVSVYLEPGEDLMNVRQRIMNEVGKDNPIVVRTMAMLREDVLKIFDRTFGVTRALQLIAIVVAVLGIVNTQVALVFERRREFAVLRYLGAAGRQIRQMVILESGLLGIVGIVLGVLAGIALAAVLILVINKQSFGWTIQAHFPGGYVLCTSLLVLLSTMIAGIYPAKLASQVNASEALRAE